MDDETPRGTRWGRASGMAAGGFGAVAVLVTVLASQASAINFTVQNTPLKFSSSAMYAQNVGLGMSTATSANGTVRPVLRAGFATARLDGFCVSKTETFGGVTAVFKMTAGDGILQGNPSSGTTAAYPDIKANNATFDITSFRGMNQAGQAGTGMELNGLDELGIAAPDVQTTPGVTNPLESPIVRKGEGWFGISGTSATLYSLKGTLWDASISGDISLPKLSIKVSGSVADECWSSQTTTTDLPK